MLDHTGRVVEREDLGRARGDGIDLDASGAPSLDVEKCIQRNGN